MFLFSDLIFYLLEFEKKKILFDVRIACEIFLNINTKSKLIDGVTIKTHVFQKTMNQ